MRGLTATMSAVALAAAGAMLIPHAQATHAGPRAAAAFRLAVRPDLLYPSHHRSTAAPQGGYVPSQVRAAYFLGPLTRSGITGKGQSIVIVDSFGSPTIARDLAVFDRTFHLPAPPALEILTPAGKIPRWNPANSSMTGWGSETSLDVEWAHAMAPAARIVLVETPVSENEGRSGFAQIVTAEEYVITHHLGGVISQSFSATEQTFPAEPSQAALHGLRAAYILAAKPQYNVTVLAASGDNGATDLQTSESLLYTFPVTSWPDSDPLVTGIGGTDVALNAAGQRTAPDAAWGEGSEGSGGGRSVFFGAQSFQESARARTGNHRGVPDVSLSASCGHPVDVYETFPGAPAGWTTLCGTSEATPLFAGIIALADQAAGHPIGDINPMLYQLAAHHAPGIADITRGSNTVSFSQNGKHYTVPGWAATAGYDLASGVGTVSAAKLVPELAALATGH